MHQRFAPHCQETESFRSVSFRFRFRGVTGLPLHRSPGGPSRFGVDEAFCVVYTSLVRVGHVFCCTHIAFKWSWRIPIFGQRRQQCWYGCVCQMLSYLVYWWLCFCCDVDGFPVWLWICKTFKVWGIVRFCSSEDLQVDFHTHSHLFWRRAVGLQDEAPYLLGVTCPWNIYRSPSSRSNLIDA